jgi:hypothetical protein
MNFQQNLVRHHTIDQELIDKMEQQQMDEKFGLPEVWARHTSTRTKQDNCHVCEEPFTVVAWLGVGNRDFFCK